MDRFPFQRTVGHDLRALYAHDRLRAQSRQLGYSSISPGDGVLEILDGGDSPLAGLGHEGGKSGLLLRRAGAWITVQEYVAAEIATGTASLGSRLSTAEGRLDSHASRLGNAEGRLGTAEGRLDSHAGRLGAVENVNTAQTTKINQTIDYAASIDSNLKTQVDAIWDKIGGGSGGKPGYPITPPPVKG